MKPQGFGGWQNNFGRPSGGAPEPTRQAIPERNIIGNTSTNFLSFKHNISHSIKSVHVTCDNQVVLFGAMRKILFKEIKQLLKSSKSQKMQEKSFSFLGPQQNLPMEVQSIECHPVLPNNLATFNGNSLSIWDLKQPGSQIEQYSCVKQITSIGWQHQEEKVIGATSQDNLFYLFDTRQRGMSSRIRLSSQATHITFNPKIPALFATAHQDEVKLWDLRRISEGQEFHVIETGLSSVRNLAFDPLFGKLMLAQDREKLKLLSIFDSYELDSISSQKMLTSQFIPLREASSPGIVMLPERSSNFIYLEIEEIPASFQHRASFNGALQKVSSSQQIQSSSKERNDKIFNLKLVQRAGDQISQKPQVANHEGPSDVDAFAICRTETNLLAPQTDLFQVISVSSDYDIRIMGLNQQFIDKFYNTELPCINQSTNFQANMIEYDDLRAQNQGLFQSRGDVLTGSVESLSSREATMSDARTKMMTRNEQILTELQEVRQLKSIIYDMKIKQSNSEETSSNQLATFSGYNKQSLTQQNKAERQSNANGGALIEFNVTLKVKEGNKIVGLDLNLPQNYPQKEKIGVRMREHVGLSKNQKSQILESLRKHASLRQNDRYPSTMNLVLYLQQLLKRKSAKRQESLFMKNNHRIEFESQSSVSSSEDQEDKDLLEIDDSSTENAFTSVDANRKLFQDTDYSVMSPGGLLTHERKQSPIGPPKQRTFKIYPPSCGFSWNCYGQMAFFSNEKYNQQTLESRPALKKFYSWPQHYSKITQKGKDDGIVWGSGGRRRADAETDSKQFVDLGSDGEEQTKNFIPRVNMVGGVGANADTAINNSTVAVRQLQQNNLNLQSNHELNSLSEFEFLDDGNGTMQGGGGGALIEQSSRYHQHHHMGMLLDSEDEESTVNNFEMHHHQSPSMKQQSSHQQMLLTKASSRLRGEILVPLEESQQQVVVESALGVHRGCSTIYVHFLVQEIRTQIRIAKNLPLAELPVTRLCQEIALKLSQAKEGKLGQLSAYWQTISIALGDLNPEKVGIWTKHPLGFGILRRTLAHLESIKDYQQIAIIAALIFKMEDCLYRDYLIAQKAQQEQLKIERIQQEHMIESLQDGKRKRKQTLALKQKVFENNWQINRYDLKKSIVKNASAGDLIKNQEPNSQGKDNSHYNHHNPHNQQQQHQGEDPENGAKTSTRRNNNISNFYNIFSQQKATSFQNENLLDQQEHSASGQKYATPEDIMYTLDNSLDSNDDDENIFLEGLRATDVPKKEEILNPVTDPFLNKLRIENQTSKRQNTPDQRKLMADRQNQNSGTAGTRDQSGRTYQNSIKVQPMNVNSDLAMSGHFRSDLSLGKRQKGGIMNAQNFSGNVSSQSKINLVKSPLQLIDLQSRTNKDFETAKFSSFLQQQNSKNPSYQQSMLLKTLLIEHEPEKALTLMIYLKKYSEILFQWGEREKASEACKLIHKACVILQNVHQFGTNQESGKEILATNKFGHHMQIEMRGNELSDYLLFSEKANQYTLEVNLTEKELESSISAEPIFESQNKEILVQKANCELNPRSQLFTKLGTQICSVCEIATQGLVYFCPHCRHGGHLDHVTDWISFWKAKQSVTRKGLDIEGQELANQQIQQTSLEEQVVPCVAGCDCTLCFVHFTDTT